MQLCIFVFIFSVVINHLSAADVATDIPSFLKICHRSDPDLNDCIKQSVVSLRPYLRNGIPALHIPACEPLHIPKLEISQSSGPISISATYKNISILGGTNFVLKSVRADLKKDRMRLKLFIPRLEMIANYYLDGQILLVPIAGNGIAHGNYTDIDIINTFQVERYQNHETGQTHFRVTDFYMDFDIGHVTIHLDNLFNGDDTLADAMNLFLNDNWKSLVAEIKPTLEENIAELFKNFSNKMFAKYPADTLLPP